MRHRTRSSAGGCRAVRSGTLVRADRAQPSALAKLNEAIRASGPVTIWRRFKANDLIPGRLARTGSVFAQRYDHILRSGNPRVIERDVNTPVVRPSSLQLQFLGMELRPPRARIRGGAVMSLTPALPSPRFHARRSVFDSRRRDDRSASHGRCRAGGARWRCSRRSS